MGYCFDTNLDIKIQYLKFHIYGFELGGVYMCTSKKCLTMNDKEDLITVILYMLNIYKKITMNDKKKYHITYGHTLS